MANCSIVQLSDEFFEVSYGTKTAIVMHNQMLSGRGKWIAALKSDSSIVTDPVSRKLAFKCAKEMVQPTPGTDV